MNEHSFNEHSFDDPQLQSIEARAAAVTPRLSQAEQQQLLYRCAYEAGQHRVAKQVRRWQGTTVAILVVAVGLSIPLVRGREAHDPSPQYVESIAPDTIVPRHQSDLPRFPDSRSPISPRVELDAWQLRPPVDGLASESRTPARPIDPHIRSLTVGALTRTIFNASSD